MDDSTETVVVQAPFAGTLNEAVGRQYLNPQVAQSAIKNLAAPRQGVLDQRLGMKLLPSDILPGGPLTAMTSGRRLASWGRAATVAMGPPGMYAFSEALQGLSGIGELPDVAVKRTGVVTTQAQGSPVLLDVPHGGRTLRIITYFDLNYNLIACVVDLTSGETVLQPQTIFTATGLFKNLEVPGVVGNFYNENAPDGMKAQLVVFNTKDLKIWAITYDPDANAFSAPVNLATAVNPGFTDSCPFIDEPHGDVLVAHAASTTSFVVKRFRPVSPTTWTLIATRTVTMTAGQTLSYPLMLHGNYAADNSEACFVYFSTLQASNYRPMVQRIGGNDAWALEGSPNNYIAASTVQWITRGCCRTGVGQSTAIQVHSQSTDFNFGTLTVDGWAYTFDRSGTPVGFLHFPYGFWPITKPYFKDGSLYVPSLYNLYLTSDNSATSFGSNQVSFYLMKSRIDLATINIPTCVAFLPVVTAAPWTVDGGVDILLGTLFGAYRMIQPSAINPASGRYAVGIRTRAVETASFAYTTLGPSWSVDFFHAEADRRDLWQPEELQQNLCVSGGVPFLTDGLVANEESFFMYPEYSFAKLAGSGVTIQAGSYGYAVVYVTQDSAGNIVRSAPFFTNRVNVPGNGTTGGQVHINPVSATWRDVRNPGVVFAEIYRTQANGSTYNYLTKVAVSNTQATEILYPGVGQGDNESNSNLLSASLIYTTGGASMDYVTPPASVLHTTFKNRRAIVDETYQTVWMTFEATEPGVAPGYNEALQIEYPSGGDITAIASMDDYFVTFKRTSIWILHGDGPLNNGQQSNWGVPQQIASDTGAVGWRGVVVTPAGIIFRAPAGFYILRRNLQVEFLGIVVQDLLAAWPNVLSSTLVLDQHQARFVCENAAGDDSIVIVYDYVNNTWSWFDYEQAGSKIVESRMCGNPPRYTLLTEDGHIFQERDAADDEAYLDDDTTGTPHFVETSVTSAQFKLGVQSWQRFRNAMLMGERQGPCGLRLEVLDANGDLLVTKTWYGDELDEMPAPAQVEYRIGARWTRQLALQFRWTTIAGATLGDGAGMRFVAQAVELENLGPRFKAVPPLGRR